MSTASKASPHPVRWGILGGARIARNNLLPALQASPWCTVHAIASRDGAVARDLAKRFGAVHAYERYEDLLDDPMVEAVYIPLPNHMHVEYALKAAQRGKHVLCEKPLALSADEALSLRDAFAGLHIAEAFMVRHQARWVVLRERLRSGRQGTARALHSLLSSPLSRADDFRHSPDQGGGAIYDMG